MSDSTHKVIAGCILAGVLAVFGTICVAVYQVTTTNHKLTPSFACAATEDSALVDCQTGVLLRYDAGRWHVKGK